MPSWTTFDTPLFLALLCGHLLGDFAFQSAWMVREKRHLPALSLHVGIIGVLSYVLAGVWEAWWLVLALVATHALTDWLKARLQGTSPAAFWTDQAAHWITIVVLAWAAPAFNLGGSWWAAQFGAEAVAKALIFTSGLVATVWMGGIVVGIAVAPYLPTVRKAGEPEALQAHARGLAKGGWLIGKLERALLFILVMMGRPESVAFLVAAKSVFRFGELRDPANRVEAEYILIGTLMSFTWGFAIAWLTRALL